MTTKIFPVKGMMCSGCVRTVQTVLKNQMGVTHVAVSLENGNAEVTFDDAVVTPLTMATALGKLGYTLVAE